MSGSIGGHQFIHSIALFVGIVKQSSVGLYIFIMGGDLVLEAGGKVRYLVALVTYEPTRSSSNAPTLLPTALQANIPSHEKG